MSLAPGTHVGPYEILAPIGAGGMGEVYRARDSKLNRDVAIKVLPAALANDADYLTRSQREAQALAALNHPNIAAIYGLEDQAIVMEMVEGQTLADCISRGPLPVEEGARIAKQIAEALEAAHEKGIIHRDLKPGNIKITPDGVVKVLDFGLAKTDDSRTTSNASISPTLTIRATEAGLILGTAAYMSPEQASGKPVDKRADIWSFGVVLWEMLTGRRLFEGETISHTLAHVLTAPIDYGRLPSKTPPAIRNLLGRCLDRDVKMRLRDIGEARITLAEPMAPISDVRPQRRWRWLAPVTAVLLVSTVALAFLLLRTTPAPDTLAAQFDIAAPSGTIFTSPYNATAISPDGRFIVFAAATEGNMQRLPSRAIPGEVLPSGSALLWLRPLESSVARPLDGTEGATFPFFSPDSKSIAFFQGGKLKRTEIAGGSVQVLCDALGVGGNWTKDGTILFSSSGGLFVVSSQGGARRQITEFAKKEFVHAWPQFLPDGKRFLFFAGNNDPSERGIYEASLSNPKQHTLILPSDGKGEYVPPRNGQKGYVLWQRERTLMAQPFDAGSLRLEESASPLAEGVAFNVVAHNSSTGFWSSGAGLLAYRVGELSRSGTLLWFDRQGKRLGQLGSAENYSELALSPVGSQVVAFRGDDLGENLWLIDIDRVVSARLTTDAANHSWPVWSPDGKQILYASNRDDGSNRDVRYNLYRKSAGVSGQDELFFKDETNKVPSDWSRDGRFVLYTNRTTGLESIWVLPMAEGERKPRKYLTTQSMDRNGVFSPNGQWVAYESEISGRAEIYVSPFPDAASAPAVLVSKDGGSFPRWRRDGKELFYLSPDTKMMAVSVVSGPSLQVSAPKTLFDLPEFTYGSDVARTWDVSPDGQRFLVNATEKQSVPPLTVVTNWHEKLKN